MSRDPSYLLLIGWKLLQSSWSLIGRKMSSQGCSQAQFSQLTADSKGKKRQLRSTGSPQFTLLHKIGTLQGVPYQNFSTGIMNSVCKKCNKKWKKVSFYFSKFLNVCLSQTHFLKKSDQFSLSKLFLRDHLVPIIWKWCHSNTWTIIENLFMAFQKNRCQRSHDF